MNINVITNAISDHPYAFGAAILAGLYLLSGKRSQTPSIDLTPTLASMQLISDANVQLAELQTQQNIAVTSAKRDLAIATMDYAKADREYSTAAAINYNNNSRMISESAGTLALQGLQSAVGYSAAKKDLENQAAYINATQVLGLADISSRKSVDELQITSARDLGISQVAASLDLGKYSLDTDRMSMINEYAYANKSLDAEVDLFKFNRPYQERFDNNQINLISRLGHQQVKIAKNANKTGLFNNLISGAFSLAGGVIGKGV